MPTYRSRDRARFCTLLAAAVGMSSPVIATATAPAGPASTESAAQVSPKVDSSANPATASPTISPELASYDVGLMLGSQLERTGATSRLSFDELVRGLHDGVGGKPMRAEERDAALQFMRTARDALVETNRKLAADFLENNGKKPGVSTMPSGLQYKVLKAGDPNGVSPGPTDQVTVRYVARFADGTEFDRSETHDHPAKFRVNSVFKGWQDAFAAMKPGATWELFVPPELGYGANSPPPVPPGALLVYELELLKVEPAETVPMRRRPSAAHAQPTAPAPTPAAPH